MHRDDRRFWLNPYVSVQTPPAESPVTVENVKAALRIDSSAEDTFLRHRIDGVTSELDGPNGWLGRTLVTQDLRLTLDCFPDTVPEPLRNLVKPLPNRRGRRIYLPFPPLQSVTSVKYIDEDGAEQTLSSSKYKVVTESEPGYIELGEDETWPNLDEVGAAVWVDYKAGYGFESDVPQAIKDYIISRVGARDQMRTAISVGADVRVTPFIENSLENYRIRTWSV